MKRNTARILSLVLALTMILTLSITVSAEVGGTVWTPSVTPSISIPPPTVTGIDIYFNGGDALEGVLDVPETALDAEGNYLIELITRSTIPESLIPGTVTADEFYVQRGWVMENDYLAGDIDRLVDMESYAPVDGDTFYAVYRDTWKPYKDMKQDRSDWFYKFVRDLAVANVVNGTPDFEYLPMNNLSYGEALKLIMLATGYETQTAADGSHWASGYYVKALEDGLLLDKNLNLNDPITRREVAEITVKALKLAEPQIASPFADTNLGAAISMYEAKLMIGTVLEDGSRVFKPETNISRAEIATVVWNIYHYFAELV